MVTWVNELEPELRIDRAMDKLFQTLDDLCLEGHFAEVDAVLADTDLDALSDSLLCGLLCITFAAEQNGELTQWEHALERARVIFQERGRENLLHGLEPRRKSEVPGS